MALTIGTPDSATIGGTEYSLPADSTTLAAQTDDCHLYVNVDWNAVAAGDLFRLRVYEKIDGTNQRVMFERFVDAPVIDPPYDIGPVGVGWDVTIIKLAGTDRAIAWRLDKDTGASGGGVVPPDALPTLRVEAGDIERKVLFIARDSSTGARKTGLSSFTVYRTREGGSATAMTTPTVAEVSSANMPGVYTLLLDEDSTLGTEMLEQEVLYRITASGMEPVDVKVVYFRPDGVVDRWTADDGGVSTITAPSGKTLRLGDFVLAVDGAGAGQGRSITAVLGQVGDFDDPLDTAFDNTTVVRHYAGEPGISLDDFVTYLDDNSAQLAASVTNTETLLASAEVYKKATAVTAFAFYMELTAGGAATGKTVTAQISKDGGVFATLAGSVTEIGSGWYEVDLTGTEMNADEIAFKATATDCNQRNIKIRTQS